MNVFKGIGKSLGKAGKYVGLTVAGAAVAGVAGVFDPEALSAVLTAAFSGNIAALALIPILAPIAGGAIGPLLVVTLRQIYKHRNEGDVIEHKKEN